jgi:YVTN family beta-propeller protein
MSKASSAGLLKMSLESSGAIESFGKFRGIKRTIAGLCLLLSAPFASAAPFAYVANYSGCTVGTSIYAGCVTVLDLALATNPVIATIPQAVAANPPAPATSGIGKNPLGIAMTPDGKRVYVVNYGDSTDAKTPGTVSVINSDPTSADFNTVIVSITVGIRPQIVTINPSGTTAYVTNSIGNTVSVIDTATNKETTKIAVAGVPVGVAFTPDGKKAYVTLADKSRVAVIDATTNTASASTIALSSTNPIGIAVNPAGTFAYVADYGQGDFQQTGIVSVIDTAKDAEVAKIPVGIGPIAVAVSPDGARVYVSNYGAGTVSVINAATNKETAESLVGSGPLGISIDTNGTYAYVNATSSGTVVALDLATNLVHASWTSGGSGPNYSVVTSSANLAVNLNQRGLTGSWYNPRVSGQGLVMESSPDVNGTGHGRLFAGWFTYDVTAAGG